MEQQLRSMLSRHLAGGEAFVPLAKAIDGLSYEEAGYKAKGMSHTIWELVYHLYYSSKDISDYVVEEDYKAGNWPDDYWPDQEKPEDEIQWEETVERLIGEVKRMQEIVNDENVDLFEQIPWGREGHNVYRGAMLIIEHNAYHTGQILDARKALGLW